MDKKYKIAFVWQGVSDEKIKEQWQDGLRYAIDKIAKKHIVHFKEPFAELEGYDLILYWEAPVTAQGPNGPYYNKVRQNPTKKALLFAGGPIKKEWMTGFDLVFLESKINEKECDDIGIPWRHAFGVNTEIFRYKQYPAIDKIYDGMLHGTCASWKRQWLLGEALRDKGLVMGRKQDSDPTPFLRCAEFGTTVMDQQTPQWVAKFLRESHTLVNPCDEWGGGQRATLEAMAMGVPVVCCNDSPKNMEFVLESGFGAVADPTAESIRNAVNELKERKLDPFIGVNYVKEKWSGDIYAQQLLAGIDELLCQKHQ